MRLSELFGGTLRETPTEAKTVGDGLLLRAAYLRSLPDGSRAELTLGRRTIGKIASLFREKLENLKAQEIQILSPSSSEDRDLRKPSHHIILSLIQKEIHSYRQLPQRLFRIQTQHVDDSVPVLTSPRAEATTRLESISLDLDERSSEESYQSHLSHFGDIFKQVGLPTAITQPNLTDEGAGYQQTLIYPSPSGDHQVMECQNCGYSDLSQSARMKKTPHDEANPEPIEKVSTPGAHTIADLAAFLNIPKSHTAKAVFSVATFQRQGQEKERLVLSIVRGDMELSETKLLGAIGAISIRPATEEEITSVDAVPGFASPVGITGALIVIDDLIPESPNLVAGANEIDFHYRNVCLGRDYQADIISDLVHVAEGDPCPVCGHGLQALRGIILGEFRQLPLEVISRFNISYLDKDGLQKPIRISTYGTNLHQVLTAVSEEHNDDFGLLMPLSISPYHIHLIRLRGDDGHGEDLYTLLRESGYEVLYDDRDERPGVCFNDADLIGIPIRLTIGKRSLEAGGVELKLRNSDERVVINLSEVEAYLRAHLEDL